MTNQRIKEFKTNFNQYRINARNNKSNKINLKHSNKNNSIMFIKTNKMCLMDMKNWFNIMINWKLEVGVIWIPKQHGKIKSNLINQIILKLSKPGIKNWWNVITIHQN